MLRTFSPVAVLLVACNEVAGIESTPCAPACMDATTRLFCDESGGYQTEACPESTSECAKPACSSGRCTFEPAPAKPCGRRGRGLCNDGFACVAPATTLSANHHHTCLVGEDGMVWCWGENAAYELGDGTTEDRGSPVSVRGLPAEAMDVSAGYAHTCALLRDGRIACWGSNESGQCGTSAGTEPLERPELVPVPDVTFTSLAAGRKHTCAVSSDRAVYCWGDATYGQAGIDANRTGSAIAAPARVEGLDSVDGIETVKDHTCAMRSLRPYFVCWGSNVSEAGNIVHKLGPDAAQLTHSALPIPVNLDSSVYDVGIGPDSSYARMSESTGVLAWGLNSPRQLGVVNEEEVVSTPSELLVQGQLGIQGQMGTERLLGVGSVIRAAGAGQCVELFDPGRFDTPFLCWGRNDHGEVGLGEEERGADAPYPRPVRALPASSSRLVRGERHACAIASEEGREEILCYGAAHLVGNGTTRSGDSSMAPQWEGMALRWNPDYVPVRE